MLQLIDRPQGITVDDAARDLTVTIRTIWRDLDALQKAGFPLYTERAADGNRGVWRVTEDFKRALPLKLTLGELAALLMSRHLLSPLGLSVLGPEVASAFDKIQNVLSRDALAVLDQIRDRLGVRPTGAKLQAPAAEHLPKIHQALAEHRTLRTRYYSASRDSEDAREIDPVPPHASQRRPLRGGALPPAGRRPHLRRRAHAHRGADARAVRGAGFVRCGEVSRGGVGDPARRPRHRARGVRAGAGAVHPRAACGTRRRSCAICRTAGWR